MQVGYNPGASIGHGTFGLAEMVNVQNLVTSIAGAPIGQLKAMAGIGLPGSSSVFSASQSSIIKDTMFAMNSGSILAEPPKSAETLEEEREAEADKQLERRYREAIVKMAERGDSPPAGFDTSI